MRKEPQLIRLDFEEKSENVAIPLSKPLSQSLSQAPKMWRIFISNLKLRGSIGIYFSEKIEKQPIIINVSAVYSAVVPDDDNSVQVVCYQQLVNNIEKLVCKGHISFVENLAEEIASLCLDDSRVSEVTVRIEKPDAIEEAASVGVEINRCRKNDSIAFIN